MELSIDSYQLNEDTRQISWWNNIFSFFSFKIYLKWYETKLNKFSLQIIGLKSIIETLKKEELRKSDYEFFIRLHKTFKWINDLYLKVEDPRAYKIKIALATIEKNLSEIISIYEADFFDWDPDNISVPEDRLSQEIEW